MSIEALNQRGQMRPEEVGSVTRYCVLQPLWSVYWPAGLTERLIIVTTNGSGSPLKQKTLQRKIVQGLLRDQQPNHRLILSVRLPYNYTIHVMT